MYHIKYYFILSNNKFIKTIYGKLNYFEFCNFRLFFVTKANIFQMWFYFF